MHGIGEVPWGASVLELLLAAFGMCFRSLVTPRWVVLAMDFAVELLLGCTVRHDPSTARMNSWRYWHEAILKGTRFCPLRYDAAF